MLFLCQRRYLKGYKKLSIRLKKKTKMFREFNFKVQPKVQFLDEEAVKSVPDKMSIYNRKGIMGK